MPDEPIAPPTDINVPPPDYLLAGKLQAEGTKESGIPERLAAALIAAVVRLLAPMVRILVNSLDEILAALEELFKAGQGEGSRGFTNLVAAALGDLLGVNVDGDKIFEAFQSRGRIAAMEEVGDGLVQLLNSEFIASGNVTPESGEAAVKSFLGFVLSFAVRQGNIEFLTSLIPEEYRFAEGFRAYGELMAKNLGLGRLTRMALRPLFTTLVATPYQWRLNQQFHPTQFRETDLINPYTQTLMPKDQVFQAMDLLGYTTDKIEALIRLHQKRLTTDEVDLLVRYQIWSPDQANQYVSTLGWPEEFQTLPLYIVDLKRGEAALRSLVDAAETHVVDGHSTVDDFSALLDSLPIGPYEKKFRLQAVTYKVKAPHAHLTTAQAQKAFEEGIWTLDDLQNYFSARGYSVSDNDTLQILTLLALAKLEDAAKLKASKAAAAAAKKAAKSGSAPPAG